MLNSILNFLTILWSLNFFSLSCDRLCIYEKKFLLRGTESDGTYMLIFISIDHRKGKLRSVNHTSTLLLLILNILSTPLYFQ